MKASKSKKEEKNGMGRRKWCKKTESISNQKAAFIRWSDVLSMPNHLPTNHITHEWIQLNGWNRVWIIFSYSFKFFSLNSFTMSIGDGSFCVLQSPYRKEKKKKTEENISYLCPLKLNLHLSLGVFINWHHSRFLLCAVCMQRHFDFRRFQCAIYRTVWILDCFVWV